jgi:hypothetical protein
VKRLLALSLFVLLVVGCHSPLDQSAVETVPGNLFPPVQSGWTLAGGAYWSGDSIVMPTGGAYALCGLSYTYPGWDSFAELKITTTAPVYYEFIGYDAGDTARWDWGYTANGSYRLEIRDIPPAVTKLRFNVRPVSGAAKATGFSLICMPNSQSEPPPPPPAPETLCAYPAFPSPISVPAKSSAFGISRRNVDYNMAAVRYNFTCTQATTVIFSFASPSYTTSVRVSAGYNSIRVVKPNSKTLSIQLKNENKKSGDVITGSVLLPAQ